MKKMNEIINRIFQLERNGKYSDALSIINNMEKTNNNIISSFNVNLIKKRLKYLINHSKLKIKIQWTAIITMWKRTDYLEEQLNSIKNQSIPPCEIIIIINENYIDEMQIRNIAGKNIKIIHSDINSLYSRWAIAYIAKGDYVSVFDDDVIPGEYWIANALRACISYNSIVVPTGRIFSKNGNEKFFKEVIPYSGKNIISCNNNDVFCDWGCNSYLFKREWVGIILADKRYIDSQKTYDDIQLAISLYKYKGIRCVVPMQPAFDKSLYGSLHREYGRDSYAIWKTNTQKHYEDRYLYVNKVINSGYIPIVNRLSICYFYIIVPFGSYEGLERCVLSIIGQNYNNFTCVLVDDCINENNILNKLKNIGLDKINYIYKKNNMKSGPLRSREIATDLIKANLNDVIIHLDGDDWFSCPDVLQMLNKIYSIYGVDVTYGNTISLKNFDNNSFDNFTTYSMSKKWNVEQLGDSQVIPFRGIDQSELEHGWKSAPWCGMHLRTFKYIKWIGHNRKTFKFENGDYLQVATDAAIFLPILSSCKFDEIAFIPDIIHVYQNIHNTIHSKNEISMNYKNAALSLINNSNFDIDNKNIIQYLKNNIKLYDIDQDEIYEKNNLNEITQENYGDLSNRININYSNGAVLTIVTQDYIPDALLCLETYVNNINFNCVAYIFIVDVCKDEVKFFNKLIEHDKNIKFIFMDDLLTTYNDVMLLHNKYSKYSDLFRWSLKSILLIELLNIGYDFAIYFDQDIYTVSDVSDLHRNVACHDISVFPHFRNPDDEHSRRILYKDGFFNAGILGANKYGIKGLYMLFKRCLSEMSKDLNKNLWDDQKYLDIFIIEIKDLFINFDRGINYNPWNIEPVEGLISPSQRSLLLRSGFFVRIFHITGKFINDTISLVNKNSNVFRPIIVIYLLSILYVNIFILLKMKVSDIQRVDKIKLFSKRITYIVKQIENISEYIPVYRIKLLVEEILSSDIDYKCKFNLQKFLFDINNILRTSVCFDNYSIFVSIIEILFGHNIIFKYFNEIIHLDYNCFAKYLTDSKHDIFFSGYKASEVGNTIKNRIEIIKKYKLYKY